MMKAIILAVAFALLIVSSANAQVNVKTIESVSLEIFQTGTLAISGNVLSANLSYYVPQEGLRSVEVQADGDMTWRYITDAFNNKLVLLEWKKPSGVINYRIKLVVENRAKHTATDKPVGTNDFYLKETEYITINDEIRQFAFPFEKSMKRAAELTKFVYDYVDYDLSYVGRNVPSDRVLAERKGVCVEHANLLTALLRANSIPTRYVVGYAYSSVQNKFIGHTWVEVLAGDGTWVPFDPTWLQAGYLDATHVKSAVLLDNSQIDTLTYLGGDIEWTRNDDEIRMTGSTERNVTSITATGTGATSDNYGYVKAVITSGECTLVDVTANSCVNEFGAKQLDIKEPERSFWTCGQKEVYWFYRASGSGYICPVSIYDQTGGTAEYRAAIQGRSNPASVSISGPDTAGVNEQFTLTASTDGIFYSPEFGTGPRSWTVSTKYPGSYKFYLYSNGALHTKNVNIVQKKEVELDVDAPVQAKLGSAFNTTVSVKNLAGAGTYSIQAKYTNQTFTRTAQLQQNEERAYTFVFTANREGINDLVAMATGNSFVSETAVINTPFEKNFLDGIIKAIGDFFAGIAGFFGSIFGK